MNGCKFEINNPYLLLVTIEENQKTVLSLTVDWSKLEIVLYTLFVLSCPTKLTGLYRTVSAFVPFSSEFTRYILTEMALDEFVLF